MHSTTSFSMNGKEGRGDTSVWTDTPLDRAQKAQQRYAYLKQGIFIELHRRVISPIEKKSTITRRKQPYPKHAPHKPGSLQTMCYCTD